MPLRVCSSECCRTILLLLLFVRQQTLSSQYDNDATCYTFGRVVGHVTHGMYYGTVMRSNRPRTEKMNTLFFFFFWGEGWSYVIIHFRTSHNIFICTHRFRSAKPYWIFFLDSCRRVETLKSPLRTCPVQTCNVPAAHDCARDQRQCFMYSPHHHHARYIRLTCLLRCCFPSECAVRSGCGQGARVLEIPGPEMFIFSCFALRLKQMSVSPWNVVHQPVLLIQTRRRNDHLFFRNYCTNRFYNVRCQYGRFFRLRWI
jgi:hypothetical protein